MPLWFLLLIIFSPFIGRHFEKIIKEKKEMKDKFKDYRE